MGQDKDVFREIPVRYLGYANEIGEAFRHYIGHSAVLATYGIATCYVLADALDKTRKTYISTSAKNKRFRKTLYTAVDTVSWQMLASVAIPGFTINRLCKVSRYALCHVPKLPPNARNVMVTMIGLGVIPFIIHPIDKFAHMFLDNTLRKFAPT